MRRRFDRTWRLVGARGCLVLVACIAVGLSVHGAASVGAPVAADPSFAPGGAIPANGVVVADFNGDGKADLGITNVSSSDVTVLLGNGAGGFAPAPGSSSKTGELPVSITAADLNRDGRADVAVANDRSKDVTVLLGNGAGGMSPAAGSPLKLAGAPGQLAVADLNTDGTNDLAVTVFETGWHLAVLLGDGSGGFTPASGPLRVLAGGAGWQTIRAGDFNSDDSPDLAVANSESRAISILLGNGSGGFGAAKTATVRSHVGYFAVADVNGDGKLDLAAATGYSSNVTILVGTGTGDFRAAPGSPFVVPGFPHGGIATADFNGDGRPDLAVGNEGSEDVAVLLGTGAGRFRQASFSPFAALASPVVVGAAELNGDTKPDLLTLSQLGLTILFQTPATPAVGRGRALPRRARASLSIRGRLISKLAADGNRAAAMTTLKNGSCGRVVVWTAPGRKATNIKTSDCSRDCARRPKISLCLPIVCRAGTACVDEIALDGRQVAWIIRSGGNTLELRLMAAKLARVRPKQVDVAHSGAGAGGDRNGSYLGRLLGGGAFAAYNSWDVCVPQEGNPPCPPVDPATGVVRESLVRVVAGRKRVIKRGPGYRLVAVGGGRMAVENAGAVSVLSADGARVATVPAVEGNPPRGVALSAGRLALERTFTLDLHNPATGAKGKSLALGPAAAMPLAGVNSTLALLRRPRQLVLVRLSDGKLIRLTPPSGATSFVDAKLTGAGLFYAYNKLGRSPIGRLVFEPNAKLLRRF